MSYCRIVYDRKRWMRLLGRGWGIEHGFIWRGMEGRDAGTIFTIEEAGPWATLFPHQNVYASQPPGSA